MLSLIRNNRPEYRNTILSSIKDNLYRKERYGLEFSLAIAICDTDISMKEFSNNVRLTDKFIVLEDYLCAVLFEGISYDSAIKATLNLQNMFQKRHFNKELFISIVTSTENNNSDGYTMINSLLNILEYSVSNDLSHEVVDSYQLEQHI